MNVKVICKRERLMSYLYPNPCLIKEDEENTSLALAIERNLKLL